MKILGRIGTVLLGIAFLAIVMAYLAGAFNEKIQPGKVEAKPLEISGTPAAVEEVTETLVEQATGTLRAKSETSVSSRITSTIVSIAVRAGDSVEEGEVLVTLDDRDLQARVEQAERSVAAIEAQLAEAKANYDRTTQLVESGVSSQAELDRARAAYESLQSERARAQRAVDEAQTALTYATIRAPLSGRVVDRYAEPGDTTSPGMPILELYDPKSLRLEANVRESLATQLQRGDQLRGRIDAIGQEFDVTIEEIVPQSDVGSRSFVVKTALPPMENIYPGMFGRLLIPDQVVERLYLDKRAVLRVGQLQFVYIPHNGGAVRRFVRTGLETDDGRVQILSGLSAGDSVIIRQQ